MKKVKVFLTVLCFAIAMPALAQSDSSKKILDKAYDIVKDRDDDRRDKYDRDDRDRHDRYDGKNRNDHRKNDGRRYDDRDDKRHDKHHYDRDKNEI